MAVSRGKGLSQKTCLLLGARAAGRCQFSGCNRRLTEEELTRKSGNFSNIAHIVASSPAGPRGDDIESHQLSDDVENLMLLCPEHHKLIDNNPGEYTVEVLREMKRKHERGIEAACDALNAKPTEFIRLVSSIKGKNECSISEASIVDALLPKSRPASRYGVMIRVAGSGEYRSPEYWRECVRSLEDQFERKVRGIAENEADCNYSVFAIAPIPLLIKFGNLLGDKIEADVFQKTRQPDTWKWLETNQTNNFSKSERRIREGNRVALVISLTAEISTERINAVFEPDVIYYIRAERMGVDCIRSIADLSAFWHLYMETCELIKSISKEVSVFPAVPISAAIEMGRRYMPGVYPKLKIFDDAEGFFEAVSVGGE